MQQQILQCLIQQYGSFARNIRGRRAIHNSGRHLQSFVQQVCVDLLS